MNQNTTLIKKGFDLGFNYKGKRMSYSRGGGGGGKLHYIILIYYSPKYKKHFGLLPVGEGGKAIKRVPDMEYYLTVNKDQMNNPAYGSLQNPVPVLKFRGVKKSMRENDEDFDDIDLNQAHQDNVYFYLSYLIDKEDFKKIFPKK